MRPKNNLTFGKCMRKALTSFFIIAPFFSLLSFGQDEKTATIQLTFERTDSTRSCIAVVKSDTVPVKGTEVHFYVKRMYSLLPIESGVETDEKGEAQMNFPLDIPGDKDGNIIVVARIEDDDTYGNVENQANVKWGVQPNRDSDAWGKRSLSASRDKAPMILIIVSNLIIAVIWGTIIYVIFQIFRIRKESQMLKTKNE